MLKTPSVKYGQLLIGLIVVSAIFFLVSLIVGARILMSTNLIIPGVRDSESPQRQAITQAIETVTTQTVVIEQ